MGNAKAVKWWILVVCAFFALVPERVFLGEEEAIVVRTQEAEYDEQSGKIVARDATLTWKGLTVLCPSLEVDTKTQEIRTQGEIQVTFGGLEARIERLLYTRATNTLRVFSFSGRAQNLAFSAQEGVFDLTKGVVTFSGNPVLSVRGFTLSFEEAHYVFATKTWQGRNVSVSREGWSGRAKRALYTEGTSLLILEEEATISKGGSSLRGERIVVNLDTSQVKVEGNVEIFLVPLEEKR
ncbi:LptA/OstA family protein [Candidatus Caldatribacterium sp.]|uniref:LptA/OstA family protein n=1 Tax=Candidatus Caldatribacterium sp. TaxID=2282143 RepID=UPI00299793E5|nr:LptA/OstA family protein [Candidatus Caldatribacterium sp.]MDW8081957.1 LptA/OstA family protein [Candidatus Calescibacterium sp.]